MWHSGSYDPQDFLGRLIGNKPWVRHAEMSMYECYDHNFFATNFHIDLFTETFDKDYPVNHDKIVKTGWPFHYMDSTLTMYKGMPKRDLILFPHRIAPEKQVEIFRDLADQLPQYEWVVCQEQELSKNEYHNLLGEAKLVFSANLQETLGISWYEGALVGTLPMVPDRLSYTEMENTGKFLYPSEWTKSFDSYKEHKDKIVERLIYLMENYNDFLVDLNKLTTHLNENYFSCKNLLEKLQ